MLISRERFGDYHGQVLERKLPVLFADRLSGKFAIDSYLNIPPHLKYVATLPCEIRMSETCLQSERCIVINDKLQDSTFKHLSYDEIWIFQFEFIIQFADERIFKIGEYLAKLQAKWLIASYAPFASDFCPQRYKLTR